jgi:DNA relaxase NicK
MSGRDFKKVGAESGTQFDLGLAPRTCNTGALNRPTLKIDWLEFTVKRMIPVSAVRLYLDLDFAVFSKSDHGMQGYTDLYQYGAVKVLHSPAKSERGTKIILSAKALDEVGVDAVEILKLVLLDCGTFARIDIALDDRTGNVDMSVLEYAVKSEHDVSRFTQFEFRQPYCSRTRKPVGNSLYFGKASSSRQVVFYDKRLERIAKGEDDTGPWLRCEVRWKKRAANILAKVLSERGLSCAGDVIRGVVDFREQDNSEIENRSVCQWWESWTGSFDIIRTGVKKIVNDVYKKASWLDKQLKKSIGQVTSILGVRVLGEIIESGIRATTQAEWDLLDPDGQRVSKSWNSELANVCPF